MRLGPWQQAAVYATLVIVALTGLVWLALHDVIEEEASDLQRWSLILHGISAFAALIVFGSLLPLHVRSGWLRRRNIASGLSITTVMAVLIGTALLLYYGGEETRMPVRWLHIGIGILGFTVFPIHVIFGQRSRLAATDHARDGEPSHGMPTGPLEQPLRRERREPIRAEAGRR
jgi:bacteriorhodopsin